MQLRNHLHESMMASSVHSMHLLQTSSLPTTQFKNQRPFLTAHQPLAQYPMQTPIVVRYFTHMYFIFRTSMFIKISTVSIRSKHAAQGVNFYTNRSSKTSLFTCRWTKFPAFPWFQTTQSFPNARNVLMSINDSSSSFKTQHFCPWTFGGLFGSYVVTVWELVASWVRSCGLCRL